MRRWPVSIRLRFDGLTWQRRARSSSDQPRATRRPLIRWRTRLSTFASCSIGKMVCHYGRNRVASQAWTIIRTHHHTDSAGDSSADDWAAMADLLDLDGEVLHAYLSEAIAWVHQVAAGRPVRRILDVGSGTGNGALALAGQLPRRRGDRGGRVR